jgi:MarR family transcriptional regulator, transcriptional regulator for hemolysin
MDNSSFVYWIGRIRKALRREFEARAEALDITAAQFQVLRRLWEGILTSTLASEVCSDGGTITGVLDRLEAKALIRRERSTEDRRAVRIYLTPAGRALEPPLMEIVAAVSEQALEGIAPEEREQLLRTLERIGGNLGTQ